MSDSIIVMHNARIVQDGTPRDLYHQPATLPGEVFLLHRDVVALGAVVVPA